MESQEKAHRNENIIALSFTSQTRYSSLFCVLQHIQQRVVNAVTVGFTVQMYVIVVLMTSLSVECFEIYKGGGGGWQNLELQKLMELCLFILKIWLVCDKLPVKFSFLFFNSGVGGGGYAPAKFVLESDLILTNRTYVSLKGNITLLNNVEHV